MSDTWNFKPFGESLRETAYAAGGSGLCALALSQVFNPLALGLSAGFGLATVALFQFAGRETALLREARLTMAGQHSKRQPSPEDRFHNKLLVYAKAAGMEPPSLVFGDSAKPGGGSSCHHLLTLHPDLLNDHSGRAEFVLAHELSHAKTRDGLSLAGMIGLYTRCSAAALSVGAFIPDAYLHIPFWQGAGLTSAGLLAGHLGLNLADRVQEYRADRNAVHLTGNFKAAVDYMSTIPAMHPVLQFFYNHPTPANRAMRLEHTAKTEAFTHAPVMA